MRFAVVCNESAGRSAVGRPEIVTALEQQGATEILHAARGADPTQTARVALAQGADVVVAAGGDGTVRAVASAVVGSSAALAVLPLGTRNHFARDLGIPMDLAGAAAVAVKGRDRWIDVGEVNGFLFVNNSSLGLYPHVARHREELRGRRGHGWLVSTVRAAAQVMARNPSVTVTVDGATTGVRTTPFVFVGNNGYEMRLFRLGRRRRLDGGELSVYMSRRTGRAALFRLATRALLGRLEQARDFDSFSGTQFTIESARSVHHVALDGEVVRLAPPLRYRIRPKALRVRAP